MIQTAEKELKAGRELDAEIAEKVLGLTGRRILYSWQDRKSRERPLIAFDRVADWEIAEASFATYVDEAGEKVHHGVSRPRHYSTDISDAWKVVEQLAPHYVQQAFSRDEIGHWEIDWCVSEESYQAGYRTVVDYSSDYETDSLPFAICLAALRAIPARSPLSNTEADK